MTDEMIIIISIPCVFMACWFGSWLAFKTDEYISHIRYELVRRKYSKREKE